MRRPPLLILFLSFALGTSAGNLRPPPASTGIIDGKVAVMFWPTRSPVGQGNDDRALLPAGGCEVHLVPHDELDRELRYPCGQWFQPPEGGYNVWLEQADLVSSSPIVLHHVHRQFEGRGLSAFAVLGEGGRVGIPPERRLASNETLRLVSVDGHLRSGGRGRIFDRRVNPENASTPVLMPAGKVVAGRFDKRSGDAIALTRPLNVSVGKTTFAWPKEPSTGSDVLLVLHKAPKAKPISQSVLELDDGSSIRAADVLIDGERVIAIWYGVESRKATLSLRSDEMFWEPHTVLLKPAAVSTVRSKASPLPNLRVSIHAPEMKGSLTIRRKNDGPELRRIEVGAGDHEVSELPADRLRVTLELDGWKLHEDVDLTSGSDNSVLFELEPIEIHGHVYLGDKEVAASIAFRNDTEWRKVSTDEKGWYRTTLLYPGIYTIEITPQAAGGPAFLEAFRNIKAGGTVDFRLPDTDYRLRVIDATTGDPIAGARVFFANEWLNDGSVEEKVAQQTTTDDSGIAALPPLRDGRLLVDVKADRYEDPEPLQLNVDGKTKRLEMRLRPIQSSARLRLLLPTHAPASGAEILALTEGTRQPVWRGTADARGNVAMPSFPDGALLIVRHPHAASMVRRWTDSREPSTEWVLNSSSSPLMLEVTKSNGAPARSAHIAFWVDDVKLSGAALAFAAWSSFATDMDGIWIGRNLPPTAARVLAFDLSEYGQTRSPAFDSLAVVIRHPWPKPAALMALE